MGLNCTAIVVTYFPDEQRLKYAIESLYLNGCRIIVVDNSPSGNENDLLLNFYLDKNIKYISIGRNAGIAYAQNIGIEYALNENADFLLLSDQDTVYPSDFINAMFDVFEKIKSYDDSICALGPCFVDENKTGSLPIFEIYHDGKVSRINKSCGAMKVSHIIASGTFAPASTFQLIGNMDDTLFIDWVDMEWCWRAQRMGKSIYGTFDIVINHQLGDKSKRLGKRLVTLHSPVRNYYIIRNAVGLMLRGKLLDKFAHRLYIFKYTVLYYFGTLWLSDQRAKDFKMMSKGFFHGFLGKSGPLL